ncbi:MAG: CO dehydrogenase/acetyl-CoA synthase subunit delta [Candidatus Nezhaarchaeales archaeon]
MSSFRKSLERRIGRIVEVRIGNTPAEGGSREKAVIVGGETTMPYYDFESENPRPPVLVPMVFDYPIKLPKPVKEAYGDLIKNPVEWAKYCVEKLKAEAVYVQLISPSIGVRSPSEAVRLVEELLQAVKVPLVIGGPGDPDKPLEDAEVLVKAAEVAHGENCLLSYASLDQYSTVAKAALQHGHSLVAYTPTDLNLAKQLNANLLDMGVPKDRIVIDPTSAALGWGFEYTYTIFERIRLQALQGDETLQMPLLCAACNAWTAKESCAENPVLGPVNVRGVLWEAVTAFNHILAGADIVLMLHPQSISLVKSLLGRLSGG